MVQSSIERIKPQVGLKYKPLANITSPEEKVLSALDYQHFYLLRK